MRVTRVSKNVGLKYDVEKPRLDLIPGDVELEVGKVYEYGARKYSEHNWCKGMPWLKQLAAAKRHLAWWSCGQDRDPESGLHHLAHAIVDLQMLFAYQLRALDDQDNRFITVTRTVFVPGKEKKNAHH